MDSNAINVFLVAWLATFCALAEADACENFNFDTKEFPSLQDPDVETDKAVESNSTFHDNAIWPARLLVSSVDYTGMRVVWDKPEFMTNNKLCAFRLHYYRGNNMNTAVADDHVSVFIHPSWTHYPITNLDHGTSYHAYLEAIFDQNVAGQNVKSLKSWILIAKTSGFGPDSPCNCVAVNTVGGSVDNCDNVTGQCPCKHFGTSIFGVRCERCVTGHYLHPIDGCVACDACPTDKLIGNGSCHYMAGERRMHCECTDNYTGLHCEQCNVGFYRVGKYCEPCDCSSNENPAVLDFCDPDTGRCKACAYHTVGDHCELCYPGYVGDAFVRSCTHVSTVAHDVGIGFLSILIIAVIVVMAVMLFRRFARRRRHLHHFLSTMKGPLGSNSAVNFVTMMEEPEMEFQPHDRQLEIIGGPPTAS